MLELAVLEPIEFRSADEWTTGMWPTAALAGVRLYLSALVGVKSVYLQEKNKWQGQLSALTHTLV